MFYSNYTFANWVMTQYTHCELISARILFITWLSILTVGHNDVLDLQISTSTLTLRPAIFKLFVYSPFPGPILKLLVYSNSHYLHLPKCGSQPPKWLQ